MRFEKVRQTRFQRKSTYIADQILQMIKAGRFTAGSKLPPERILAEQMEVGRPSVREAISALQIMELYFTLNLQQHYDESDPTVSMAAVHR